MQASYDGYASCPVFVGDNKLMLCEFKYGRETYNTFYEDQTQPMRRFYSMKKRMFPWVYWNLMPRVAWFGAKDTFWKPKYDAKKVDK